MKKNGSPWLWFWAFMPSLFVGALFLFGRLDWQINIGDRSVYMAIAAAMFLASPFVWWMRLEDEAPTMNRIAVRACKIVYGLQASVIVLACIVMPIISLR